MRIRLMRISMVANIRGLRIVSARFALHGAGSIANVCRCAALACRSASLRVAPAALASMAVCTPAHRKALTLYVRRRGDGTRMGMAAKLLAWRSVDQRRMCMVTLQIYTNDNARSLSNSSRSRHMLLQTRGAARKVHDTAEA